MTDINDDAIFFLLTILATITTHGDLQESNKCHAKMTVTLFVHNQNQICQTNHCYILRFTY